MSYFSSLLTTTTSRIGAIRQNLLPTENDGDTEDDTHICRVLRSYYTEKGRSFPAWLPPDPKAPPPVVVAPVYSQSNVGAGYGGLRQGAQGGNALSSLWDSQPQQGGGGQEPQSLRAGGRGRFGQSASAQGGQPQRANPFSRQQSTPDPGLQVQARPLPSQRAGSYQTAGAGFNQTPPGSSNGPMSAKDRLAGRFGNKGGRAAGSTPPPTQATYGSGNANAGSYEDRFAPSGGGAGGNKPFIASNSPWASSESEFGGGGYEAPAPRRAPQGLPSGPGAGRRGPGLPSGPRGMR